MQFAAANSIVDPLSHNAREKPVTLNMVTVLISLVYPDLAYYHGVASLLSLILSSTLEKIKEKLFILYHKKNKYYQC